MTITKTEYLAERAPEGPKAPVVFSFYVLVYCVQVSYHEIILFSAFHGADAEALKVLGKTEVKVRVDSF